MKTETAQLTDIPPQVLADDIGAHGRTSALAAKAAAPRPETDDEIRASIVARIAAFGREDLILARRVLAELPFDLLVRRCQRATSEGVEREGVELKMLPTPALVVARAQLLSAMDSLRPLVGLVARVKGGVRMYLRGHENTATEAGKAST